MPATGLCLDSSLSFAITFLSTLITGVHGEGGELRAPFLLGRPQHPWKTELYLRVNACLSGSSNGLSLDTRLDRREDLIGGRHLNS